MQIMIFYSYILKFINSELLFVLILLSVFSCSGSNKEMEDLGIGGDIQLTAESNPRWKLSENAKDINLVFFGYTACPDYCPMTLSKFKKLNHLLGNKKNNVQYIFVSVDEKRDSPERLKQYVDFYVDNGVGLSGSPDEIQKVLSEYKGSFKINGEFIDHSTYTYLVDKNLKTRYLFKHADTPEKLKEIIDILL